MDSLLFNPLKYEIRTSFLSAHVAGGACHPYPVPETPLSDIAFIDKWTHLVMYGGLCLTIWYEVFLHHGMKPFVHLSQVQTKTLNWRHLRIGALYLPTFLGGYIEVLQATCTNGTRSGDVIDWLADTLGVVIIWIVAWGVVRSIKKV